MNLFFPSSFDQTLAFFSGWFESGKDGTPLGLNGALGIYGEKIGEIYRFLASQQCVKGIFWCKTVSNSCLPSVVFVSLFKIY